jgi:hypothetical protein
MKYVVSSSKVQVLKSPLVKIKMDYKFVWSLNLRFGLHLENENGIRM